jgi:hypothetical protein
VLALREKTGTLAEALDAAVARKLARQAKRLRELEANRAMGPPHPLALLEQRERARQQRHMGSVLRRLHRQGKLAEAQLDALERWALDHGIARGGVRSNLGKEPGGGEPNAEPGRAQWQAEGRFTTARAALYVGAGPTAGRITEAVACANMSLSAAVAHHLGARKLDASEALEMVKAGAAALARHYGKGRGA